MDMTARNSATERWADREVERHRLLAVVGAIAALAKLDASDPACDFSEVEALGRELVEAARLIRKARNRSAW